MERGDIDRIAAPDLRNAKVGRPRYGGCSGGEAELAMLRSKSWKYRLSYPWDVRGKKMKSHGPAVAFLLLKKLRA